MPRPPLRDPLFEVLGASHAYKTGTASTSAQTIVSAAGSGLSIRVKEYRFVAVSDWTAWDVADTSANLAWLSDGSSTPLLALGAIPGADAQVLYLDTGNVVLPSYGVKGSANTALTIDWTSTDSKITFMVDVFYDVVDSNNDVQ